MQPEAVDESLPTLADVVEVLREYRAEPMVVAGQDQLSRPVRWVHVSELTDIAGLLRGGELVLTTGIGLPDTSAGLRHYVDTLDDAAVSGLVIELGRRYTRLPTPLVAAARLRHLPIIALGRETRFVEITEAVHTKIVDARVHELERLQRVNERFSALTLEGASIASILQAAAELAGAPIVLENLAHRVLSSVPWETTPEELLQNWERRSRTLDPGVQQPNAAAHEVWTTTPVGARGEIWGRLILIGNSSRAARLILQRAAAAVALTRLSDRNQASMLIQAHHGVFQQVLEQSFGSRVALNAQAAALGFPLERRLIVGVAVAHHARSDLAEPGIPTDLLRTGHLERVTTAAADSNLSVLLDSTDGEDVVMLASFGLNEDWANALRQFADHVHDGAQRSVPPSQAYIGIGAPVTDITDARRSLMDAQHVVAAVVGTSEFKRYFELPDIRIRGFLHTLRNDSRLQTFVERELSALLSTQHSRDDLRTWEVFLALAGNKSAAAAELSMSRPALYHRLARIESVLGCDLDDGETRLSLHAAVIALRSMRGD